jgi:serine protease Do
MSDTLRTKLNLILTAVVAFAVGLAITAPLVVPPDGMASAANAPLQLDVREPSRTTSDVVSMSGFSAIAEQITPAVVTINVRRASPHITGRLPLPAPFDDDGGLMSGSGSGFIITEDGYIVTNNHVVDEAVSIEVLQSDGRVFDNVRLVGRDETTDVALLKVDADGLPHAPLGSSEATRVGDWVLAIGSPGFSLGATLTTTVTVGIVSAKGRSINILREDGGAPLPLAIEDFIQTDAVINPGNSGGPLINAAGEVIGVNSAIASTTGSYQGYGFAVPIDLVQDVIEDLVEFGTVRRALLGVSVRPVDDADARYYGLDRVGGAKVFTLQDDMPARDAGILVGDVITAVAGRSVVSVSDLQRHVRRFNPDDIVEVELVRMSGARETVSLRLASAPAPDPVVVQTASAPTDSIDDPIGIQVGNISADLRRSLDLPAAVDGVVVTGIAPNGPFARRLLGGLGRSPIITSVNRTEIDSVEDYERVMRDVEPGDVVGLTLFNSRPVPGADFIVPLTVPVPSSRSGN